MHLNQIQKFQETFVMLSSFVFSCKVLIEIPKIRLELKLREEALKDLKRLAKCVRAGGGWLYILVKLFSGFISLLFVCQRRDILHYANNDFL